MWWMQLLHVFLSLHENGHMCALVCWSRAWAHVTERGRRLRGQLIHLLTQVGVCRSLGQGNARGWRGFHSAWRPPPPFCPAAVVPTPAVRPFAAQLRAEMLSGHTADEALAVLCAARNGEPGNGRRKEVQQQARGPIGAGKQGSHSAADAIRVTGE